MWKSLFLVIFFLISGAQHCFGQNNRLTAYDSQLNKVQLLILMDTITCKGIVEGLISVEELFTRDSTSQNLNLFLQGGIAPTVFTTDSIFENTYNIQYYDFGCTSPNYKCVKEYNFRVFAFLTKKYGRSWRNKIRADIIGYKDWKRKKKIRRLYLEGN